MKAISSRILFGRGRRLSFPPFVPSRSCSRSNGNGVAHVEYRGPEDGAPRVRPFPESLEDQAKRVRALQPATNNPSDQFM